LAAGARDRRMLLLLDISMPKVDGLEALKRIKADPVTRSIPVYMLTTTDNPVEVNRCFELGCNAYLTKPISYEAFIATIQHLCAFLEVTQLPAAPPPTQNVFA
jgi:CheY-like chemotaxis protein